MSRIDDVINTAGHRLSTAQMEEILLTHHDVSDAAVVSLKDKLKGEIPMGFVVLSSIVQHDCVKLAKDLALMIRT